MHFFCVTLPAHSFPFRTANDSEFASSLEGVYKNVHKENMSNRVLLKCLMAVTSSMMVTIFNPDVVLAREDKPNLHTFLRV